MLTVVGGREQSVERELRVERQRRDETRRDETRIEAEKRAGRKTDVVNKKK
jgi:hypothetical protein